ncbi:MAG: MFS transporter [Promethearchaeota archaeon]
MLNFFLGINFLTAVLMPFYENWGNLNIVQIMLLQSWYLFWIFILEIPSGSFADFYGRKKTLIIAAILYFNGLVIYSIRPSLVLFMIAELFMGLSQSLISGTIEALLYDSIKKIGRENESQKFFGRLSSAQIMGILISAPIGGLIADYLGLVQCLYFQIIASICVLLVSLFLKEAEHRNTGLSAEIITDDLANDRETTDNPATRETNEDMDKEAAMGMSYVTILRRGVKIMFSDRRLKFILIDDTIVASIVYFIIWFGQLKLMDLNMDLSYFGMVTSGYLILDFILMNMFGKFDKIFKNRKIGLFMASFLIAIGYILLGLSHNLVFAVILIFMISSFGLARSPYIKNISNKYIPGEERATALSMFSLIRQLVLMILNGILGFFASINLNLTFCVLGGFLLIYSIFSPLYRKEIKI